MLPVTPFDLRTYDGSQKFNFIIAARFLYLSQLRYNCKCTGSELCRIELLVFIGSKNINRMKLAVCFLYISLQGTLLPPLASPRFWRAKRESNSIFVLLYVPLMSGA